MCERFWTLPDLQDSCAQRSANTGRIDIISPLILYSDDRVSYELGPAGKGKGPKAMLVELIGKGRP
jgi:hypothetical protein